MNENETPQKPAAVKVLTRSEVASILGIAPKTLANWHSTGIGPPAMRLHGLVRYDEADFIAWYKACKAAS
ncbi:helix-turn-helix transcriptional regulator [Arthrobacter zhaoguopingii]|uniref:helix-turn-helix transcriptional regulator n=1 Tax=Arthrobacter zhaoguopingii TaxID=2681491 RepID=UPI001FE2668A|nr:helix-turn-helix domain-containing protein [Arthrobacter zhaoguopingii]